MKNGFLYVEGFCEQDHYRGLYPVEYVQDAEKQPYNRKAMSCSHVVDGSCKHFAECNVINAAPETMAADEEWKLRDRMVGFR